MHSKLFLTAAFFSTALAAGPDPILSITPNAAQSSQIELDLSAYVTSLIAQPQYSSVLSVLATGLPKNVLGPQTDTGANLGTDLVAFALESAYTPYTALPNDVQSYLSSVGGVGVSIFSKELGSAATASTTASTLVSTGFSTGPSTGPSVASATASTISSALASTATPTGPSTASATAASKQSATPTGAAAASIVCFQASGLLIAAVAVAIALL